MVKEVIGGWIASIPATQVKLGEPCGNHGSPEMCSGSRSLGFFTAASIAAAAAWEFVLLPPSSRRRLAPDKRQVTVWSPYRRLTFNETHLRPVCSCPLTQRASPAQSLRGQVFYERRRAVKIGPLKERECRKASDAAPTAEGSLFADVRFAKSVI